MRPGGGRRPRWTDRPRAAWTPVLTFVIAGFASVWGLVAPNAANGSSAPSSPAAVVSVSATSSVLPAGGGSVTVTGKVQHANTCRLELLSNQSFPVVYSDSPKSCTAGVFSAHVTIGANPSPVSRTISFDLVARNSSSSFTAGFSVVLSARTPAAVLSASASPSTVSSQGGQVTVSGVVENASSCRLELLSKQSFPVVYSDSPKSCTSGTFSAHVTIGANPSPLGRTVAFALVARNESSSSTSAFHLTLAAKLPQVHMQSVQATPSFLPSGGGQVTVAGTVEHATTCHLELLSSQSFPVVFSHNAKDCAGGSYSASVVIGANPSAISRTVSFDLVASNATSSATGAFYVALAAPPPPTTTTTVPDLLIDTGSMPDGSFGVPYDFHLDALGGVPPYVWSGFVGLPPGLSGSSHGVITGTPTQGGSFDFTVTVADSDGNQTSASFPIAISGGATTTTVPAATTTTTVPAATTTTSTPGPDVQQFTSDNWSGYAVSGGPYTAVSGTFTLSTLTDGTPATGDMVEWVGIDGWGGTGGASANDLIQAGVLESMDPCEGASTNANGPYNADEFWICPWTTFIEDGQLTEGPIPGIALNAGDSITVEIWQQSGTDWAISMTDNTTGQSWSIGEQYYAGPGSTAEWIVEAPGQVGQGCGVVVAGAGGQCPLAPYSPPVSFSALGITPGAVNSWYEIGLVQGGVQVSTPSALSVSGSAVTGFDVSYTGVEESANGAAGRVIGRAVETLATPLLEMRPRDKLFPDSTHARTSRP